MKLTPRMVDALQLLEGCDGALEFSTTHIGRPTKQRLAKHKLAAYLDALDGESKWDAPMRITEAGRVALAGVRAGRRHPHVWSDAHRAHFRIVPRQK